MQADVEETGQRARFHWRLLHGGERGPATRAESSSRRAAALPDLDAQIAFCRDAERWGMSGLLTDFGAAKPDSILLATALARATERIEFIIAYRSGLLSPTLFAQQLNTLSQFCNGRLSLNIVAGDSPQEQRGYGDWLAHDERYARTGEMLAICRALWRGGLEDDFEGRFYRIGAGRLNTPYRAPARTFPEIFIAGGSPACQALAVEQGTCWMRLADTPEVVADAAAPILATGTEVGLRLSIIAAPTRKEALAAAHGIRAEMDPSQRDAEREKAFIEESDSVSMQGMYDLAATEWLTPTLWTGLVRTHGAPCIALVGDPDEVADGLLDYRRAGISQFILAGWPKHEQMCFFGEHVLPRYREKERALYALPNAVPGALSPQA